MAVTKTMIVGLLQMELHLPMCNSLKDKRSVLKRLFAKLRQRHNIGVAELDHHDVWRSAQVGAVTVSNETPHVEKVLHRVASEIVSTDGIEVVDQLIEIL